MARIAKPYNITRRGNAKTFQFTLTPTSGLPLRVCTEWQRRSFTLLPDELSQYRYPKTKSAAEAAVVALIAYLKQKVAEGNAQRVVIEDITMGAWLEKFTKMETSPRTAINASKNRPNSPGTFDTYKSYFEAHIKNDTITQLKMAELEESDILEYINRLSFHKKEDGSLIGGTRTHAGVIIFLRMAFTNYQKKFPRWFNPFLGLDAPQIRNGDRDALPEDEVLRLFYPGVLKSIMELAVCACMFWYGLRRVEIAALRPEDLDWHTPKITVRHAWQRYDREGKVLGPTKGKKNRDAPFDPIIQEAIKKLWQDYGEHEWVFSFKGKILHSQWVRDRFPRWLKDAGIELNGREIVPHSSRHSLASLLEARGISLRYIQDLLGHSDLKTTKIYLHSPAQVIRVIGQRITEAREEATQKEEPEQKIVDFRVS